MAITDIYLYLKDYREEEPEYIARYLHGEQITFKDIMSSRVGYYAGYYQRGNCDGTLIKVGNKSHSVHSFLYADSVKRKELEEQICKEGSFRGYHPVGQIEWQESDIMPSGQHPILKLIRNIQETPYCFSLVMERDEDKDDTWGAEHFIVTFLFGNYINIFYWLFRKEYSKAPWLIILNERYKGTIFERDIQKSHLYPQFVIFAPKNNIWEGYEKVENVSPVFDEFRKRRDLFHSLTETNTKSSNHTDNNELNRLLTELFARPDWENYLDNSLEIGCEYVYPVSDETAIRGRVLFNDGVTAILKVTNRYVECFFEILYYNEVRRFFPEFKDPDAHSQNEYLCLDVETESNLFFRDPDTNVIGHYHFDDDGEWVFSPIDDHEFRMDRIKRLFTHLLAEMEKEEEEKQKSYDSTISVNLSGLAIDEMYNEYDEQHGNPNSEDVLSRSLNRSIKWLTQRNCAIVTAWRGEYNRNENNDRNSKLKQKLKVLGYGVIQVKGCYAEIGRPLEKENSFLVFDLDDSEDFMQNIYDLSEHYQQDSFLYKPVDEEVAYLVGTNDHYGKGKIELAGFMKINSETADNFTQVASGIISFEKNSA